MRRRDRIALREVALGAPGQCTRAHLRELAERGWVLPHRKRAVVLTDEGRRVLAEAVLSQVRQNNRSAR